MNMLIFLNRIQMNIIYDNVFETMLLYLLKVELVIPLLLVILYSLLLKR